jgi:hypothetical protein
MKTFRTEQAGVWEGGLGPNAPFSVAGPAFYLRGLQCRFGGLRQMITLSTLGAGR